MGLKKALKLVFLGGIAVGLIGLLMKKKEVDVRLEREDYESESIDEKNETKSGNRNESKSIEDISRSKLEDLSYRDLQGIAKDLGVKANIKREEMVERILEEAD